MPPLQGQFDASQFAPKQVGESHPVGKFPFQISHTECVPTKSGDGGMFVVMFKTPSGEIPFRYNLWNQGANAAKTIEIAHGQLSALCHATGIFKLNWENEGAALRGGHGMIDVGFQKGQEPSAENPNGGYTEIKKIYDAQGNEPGKSNPAPQPQGWGNQQAQPQQQQPQPEVNQPQPMTQQPSGWGNQQQAPQSNSPPWKR